VLVLLIFLASQLFNTAATVTTLAHKRMDADAQTRQLLDRMAIDFAQMVKRSDVDYYLKSSATPPPTGVRNLLFAGNDTIAFYSTVPGYYPSSGAPSPLSLVAYRVNANSSSPSYNKLERMGKGLVWNAVSTTDTPVVFMPVPVASPIPKPELPSVMPSPSPAPAWPEIANSTTTWSNSEVIGPQVFRFEYYYLLRGQSAPASAANPTPTPYSAMLSDIPWDTRICVCPSPTPTATPTPGGSPTPTPSGTPIVIASPTPPSLCCHVAPEGMQDVAAVVVVIAVIDPKSKTLLDATGTDPSAVAARLVDWGNTTCAGCPSLTQWQTTPGLLRAQWQSALNGITSLPRPAISGIRVYERYMYLSPPTLLTP
jgi:hypothetical protein